MRILHLFSDWKWTGPAEPVLDLCKALAERGHTVVLAYRRPPMLVNESVEKGVLQRGFTGVDTLSLAPISKSYHVHHVVGSFRDITRLARYIDAEAFEVVNVHLSHDHIVGALAARRSKRRPAVIRTDHKRDSLETGRVRRWFYRKFSDGVVTFSEKGREKLVKVLGFPLDRVVKVPTAVDLDRFDPEKGYKNMRQALQIPPSSPLVGMVARFQGYRRTDILLEAISLLIKEIPEVRLLLVGRSSQMKKSVIEPMERLGISSHVILAGYRIEDYVDVLASMDIFVLLTPGSDGTARALREAMAMGKAAVVARKGMLPELVQDGLTGLVVDEDPRIVHQALLSLLRDEQLRSRIGQAAREMAVREFRIERQAQEMENFYQRCLRRGSSS